MGTRKLKPGDFISIQPYEGCEYSLSRVFRNIPFSQLIADGCCYGEEDEESDRDPDYGSDEDDDHTLGCVFPGECCMPGLHLKSECHTAAMMVEQHYEALIEEYKEQVEDLEDALKNIFNGTFINVETAGEKLLGMIVKLTHEYADKALEKSDQAKKVR